MDIRFENEVAIVACSLDKLRLSSAALHGTCPECRCVVMMRPSEFLILAPELDFCDNADHILEAVFDKITLGIPHLKIDFFPDGFDDGYPEVFAHDGRHRMLAVQILVGNVLVPVGIESGLYVPSSRDVRRLRSAAWSQEKQLVKGPLFEKAWTHKGSHPAGEMDEFWDFLKDCAIAS